MSDPEQVHFTNKLQQAGCSWSSSKQLSIIWGFEEAWQFDTIEPHQEIHILSLFLEEIRQSWFHFNVVMVNV